jgi:pseudouridylate synthase
MIPSYLAILPEIKEGLSSGKPVVALESTIISHGMPFPQNVQTALQVEQEIRNQGAIPATIALMGGKLCVGLNQDQLNQLGNSPGVWKVSLRDIPYVLSQKQIGASTVAATMRIAAMAGIKIFVTGGIGGVHRGAEASMDISADLPEMGRTSVAVVSAGVKSILDVGKTLEYLETLGVPVVSYGQSAFPSFYSRESGYLSPIRLDNPKDIANLLQTKWALGLEGGVLIANPIQASMEIPKEKMEVRILEALEAAEKKKVTGKDVTPFLLSWLARETRGESLEANIELIKNNARLGAQIAVSMTAEGN